METGVVFNIQKCSVHDGPGIRTLVFLKGCPLQCLWCANPESQDSLPEVVSSYHKCIACGACLSTCPQKCIEYNEGRYIIDVHRCDRCGQCTEICYAESKRIIGSEMTSDELLVMIQKDMAYYQRSGGGVTFSGGEPLAQPEFLKECAQKCERIGISVAIETCGFGNYARFRDVLDHISLVFYDLKHVNDEEHHRLTGCSNQLALRNLELIAQHDVDIHVRIPVIPGYNDSQENLEGLARIAARHEHVREVELMAYHALGVSKYEMLGRPYLLEGVSTPSDETMNVLAYELDRILAPVGKRCKFVSNLYSSNKK